MAARADTGAHVRELARRAATDPAALRQLRSVRSVDGRPVDLGRSLRTSSPNELRARLRVLAGPGASGTTLASPASEARSILAQRRFRGSAVPRPFHGALVWLGKQFRPVVRAVHWLGDRVPGGVWAVWTALAFIVVLAALLIAGRIARRRGVVQLEQSERTARPSSLDPRELDREADAAEEAGDAARALRLRFRSGLLRLGRARVVPLRDSLTSGEARRIVRLPEFDQLARTHDEVVYGDRQAVAQDAADARERWPRVLATKGVRT